MIHRLNRLTYLCHTLKPSKGFQAIQNPTIRAEVLGYSNPKLDALAEVLQSLTNTQTEYLNLLLAQKTIDDKQSILFNKTVNKLGYPVEPIQYFYQQAWITKQWKEMQLLQFVLSDAQEELGDKVEAEVVKDNYDVELTSLDASSKIKIIKALREMFNLGLKEAKDLADRPPSMLKKAMKKEEAEKLKKDLQVVGCVITLK